MAEEITHQVNCKNCGATLKYAPGTDTLKCEYCGAVNEIEGAGETKEVHEIDYADFIANHLDNEEKQEIVTIKCTNCGASTTLKPNVTSDDCPFCGTSLILTSGTTSAIIKPQYVLPFKIDDKQALDAFGKWIKGLWWAPNNLKKYAETGNKLNGMYIPYWTYTSDTSTAYTGERGDFYEEEEEYTTEVDGETVVQTRMVTRTLWTPVSGYVTDNFKNILVLASNSLPPKYTRKLEPWDLTSLTDYRDEYLSGFRTESYQVDVTAGLQQAEEVMKQGIAQSVRKDIGGDQQQVYQMNTKFDSITFKHILLPVWLSTYRYNNKAYRFMINGRTGDVEGERPYSAMKIVLFILMIIMLIIILFGVLAAQHSGGNY